MNPIRTTLLFIAALTLAGCSSTATPTADPRTDDQAAIEAQVRASVEAENAGDAEAFTALWTDAGLASYDVGTREDLLAGESRLGADPITIVAIPEIEVEGDEATAVVHGSVGEARIAAVIFEVALLLVRTDGVWLIDGFEFRGSPAPGADATVIDVEAKEYAFVLDRTEASGDVAFRLRNTGKEHHELALFRAPGPVDVAGAIDALGDVDGNSFDRAPEGYVADHIGFAEPGQEMDVSFAEPLGAGTYVLVCFIPEGGLDDRGEPVDDRGTPHVKLGMAAVLTVS